MAKRSFKITFSDEGFEKLKLLRILSEAADEETVIKNALAWYRVTLAILAAGGSVVVKDVPVNDIEKVLSGYRDVMSWLKDYLK